MLKIACADTADAQGFPLKKIKKKKVCGNWQDICLCKDAHNLAFRGGTKGVPSFSDVLHQILRAVSQIQTRMV